MTSTAPATAADPLPNGRVNAAECRDVMLTYNSKVALANVDLDIPAGAVTALIGPNGAGKSTLLHALAGLIRAQRGELRVPARERADGVALVLQATDTNSHLPLTVYEAVAMGRYPYRRYWRRLTRQDRSAIDAAMNALQISDLAGAQLWEISGGQRQRALIAQGLAQEAELLLLDEPYTGLDILSQAAIRAAVEHQRALGKTVVMSTHDIADATTADRVVLLAGRIVAAGKPESALTDVNLSAAYGGRVVHVGDGRILLDDPHHPSHGEQYHR